MEPIESRAILTKQEINNIFSNISILLEVHKQLLIQLEKEISIGDAFLQMV